LPVFRSNNKVVSLARRVKALLNPEANTTSGENQTAAEQESPRTPEEFDNREFWEARYTTDLGLGSGAGSRGEFAEYKRQLLTRTIEEFRPRSILDVGCGDIEVTRGLPFDGEYTGIDLSPTIVARNRTLRPDWNFIEGDFLDLVRRDQLGADLVICFDVLIHQHDYETYKAFARELVIAARKVAIVNGFEQPRGKRHANRNTAYHEPITHTLTELGEGQMQVIGPFRNNLVVRIVRDGKSHENLTNSQ
jgi:SAM-dependent methyltransferase